MAARKTAADYEADIMELIHRPTDDTTRKKIRGKVDRWIDRAPLRIQVANNEQTPWTDDMLGYTTESLPTKSVSGMRQTGDYVGVIATAFGDRYIDIVVERKSVEDAYNTFVVEKERKRFYREIARFEKDTRFKQMVVIVEGNFSDYIGYQPSFDKTGYNHARRYATSKNAIINEKKCTVIADIQVAGVSIWFADNPTLAAKMCGRLFRESVRINYWKLLRV